MKKLLLIYLLASTFSFAQDVYQYKSGGRIFENGKRLHRDEIESYFGHKKEIMKEYNAGRTKKTVGDILLGGGIGLIIGHHLTMVKNNEVGGKYFGSDVQQSNVPYYIGAAAVIISIPVRTGYSKRIKNAVHLMNQELLNQKKEQSYNIEYNIIGNSNGVGIKMTF